MKNFLILLSILSLCLIVNSLNFNDITIENAERKINLSKKYPQFTTTLKFTNNGKSKINSVYLALRQDWVSQQYLLIITEVGNSEELSYKFVEDMAIKKEHQAVLIEISLKKAIEPNSEISLTIVEKYYNILSFLPKKIQIKDDQLVLFEDNAYIFSPYLIKKQKTEFTLSGTPISRKEDPSISKQISVKGFQVIYGSFENISPFSTSKIQLHFMNNYPFALFKSIKSIIEVSHWGNIAIQTFYELKNEGATFTGEYSRVDYNQYAPGAGKSALKSLSAELPYHAWGLYYRDEIGNVSTSNAQRRNKDKDVKLDITPRFSLFGGWKSNFEIGYNLPLHHYLFQSPTNPNEYTLQQFFGFPFEGFIAEQYELRIVLPEGATNIESELPFLVDEHKSVTYSYLDTVGKPTVVLKKNLISDYHSQTFNIKYTLNQYQILFKPALLFAGFFLLFMTFIIIKRLEFKSLKVEEEKKNL